MANGYTQSELAEILNIPTHQISVLLKGKAAMNLRLLKDIKDLYEKVVNDPGGRAVKR
jgi:plasmid maintenance system antidote protein VapI